MEASAVPQQPRVRPNLMAQANPLSKLFFCWVGPVFRRAYKKKTVQTSDLFEIMQEDSSEPLGARLEKNWDEEVETKQAAGKKPSLVRTVMRTFGPTYAVNGVLFMCEEACRLVQPIFLQYLTAYFSVGSTVTQLNAYLFAMGIALSALLLALIHGPNFFGIQRLGMQTRVALCTLMYKKTLKLNNSSLRVTTAGQVNNLMTNDVNRFDQLYVFLHYLWLGPLVAAIILVLLYVTQIQEASLPGYVVLILLLPTNMWLGKLFSILRRKTAAFTDQRVAVMTEVITAMRVIKMYAWEKPFAEVIKKLRKSEINKIVTASYPLAVNVTLGLFGNRLLDVGMILYYTLTTDYIETAKIFAVISFCNALRVSFMRMFPRAIQFRSETLVSLARIEKYLLLEEKPAQQAIGTRPEGLEREDGIVAENVTCSWEEDENTTQLKDISFSVKKEKLLAVVGPVGAGKSSLLMAILKELPALQGSIKCNGRVAYASQQPWVFGGTVRDNITFGRPYAERKYRSIIRVCALVKDIELLPEGDQTMVGERGVTLSGGQKARINLARALYDDADIYLLDDPLSAVDSEVSRHIFEKCIMEYLADKPRILVTHQLQFLNAADQILVLRKGGAMDAIGTLAELHERGVEFSKLMQRDDEEEEEDEEEDDEEGTADVPIARLASGSFSRSGSSRRSSMREKKASSAYKQFKAEGVQKGDITFTTYLKYFAAGGNPFSLFCMLIIFLGTQVTYLMADYWVGYWADSEEARNNSTAVEGYPIFKNVNLTTEESAGVYGGLIAGLMFLAIVRGFITFRIMINAARVLHNRMFSCVTRTPILFFDTTPTGRIQNRFTKDIGIMDDQLPLTFFDFLQISLQIIGTVLITVIMSPFTLVAVIPLFVILALLTHYALIATTAVKRLDGILRSPVFSHTTGSLHGLWTIRAYRKETAFVEQFHHYQDRHSEAWFMYIATNRWFGLRLDLLVFVFLSAVSVSCVPLKDASSFLSLDAGQVGLILTNCVALSTIFQFCVRQSALVENQMTSVERVMEYTHLDSEGPLEKPDVKPPPGWPPKGAITFDSMSLAYSKDTPRVLKEVCCDINPREKIGIVGRTGAGKSSLITALFRLAEPIGTLQIDNIQTTELGLHDVRKKISIIPQDPVIFTGSLRRNLDPFGEHSDAVMWSALEDVQLHRAVQDNVAKLDMEVGEGGSNFSVGQRQLICLARAILKRNRILILDEATANVDPRTDALIQETIRLKFKNCTVLTIAHRLHTIMDCDRVMVLDAGELIEFDYPFDLLQNPDSTFSKLVDQTGKAEAAKLLRIATEHYEKTVVSRKMLHYEPKDAQCDYVFVILKKSREGYGFSLRGEYGPLQTPVTVSEVMEGTPAAAPFGLKVGDEVLALNGESRRTLTPESITDAFTTNSSEMSLIVRRMAPAPAPSGDEIAVLPMDNGLSTSQTRPDSLNNNDDAFAQSVDEGIELTTSQRLENSVEAVAIVTSNGSVSSTTDDSKL